MLLGMPTLSTNIGGLVNGLLQAAFPPVCLFCHQAQAADTPCCTNCLEGIKVWPPATCRHCGDILPETLAPGPCGHCLQRPPAQITTTSLFHYSGPVREALLAFKLQAHPAALDWLLDAATPRLRSIFQSTDLLVPVPMPLSRMRSAGQHHAAELCRRIAARTGCQWDWQILGRQGEQARQSSLSGAARRRNLHKAFTLRSDALHNMQSTGRLWIIDDILTTGATLHHAAKALKPLTDEVHAFSIARSGKEK